MKNARSHLAGTIINNMEISTVNLSATSEKLFLLGISNRERRKLRSKWMLEFGLKCNRIQNEPNKSCGNVIDTYNLYYYMIQLCLRGICETENKSPD